MQEGFLLDKPLGPTQLGGAPAEPGAEGPAGSSLGLTPCPALRAADLRDPATPRSSRHWGQEESLSLSSRPPEARPVPAPVSPQV